jgi:hypothetical protein
MSLLYRSPFGPRHPEPLVTRTTFPSIPSVLLAPTLRAFPPTFPQPNRSWNWI